MDTDQSLSKERRMLLWTIQHKAAYDILLETGRLIANEKYLLFEG